MVDKEKMEYITIRATVSRTVEINKQWYKFEYSEERVSRKITLKADKKKLWDDAIKEVENQIEDLRKDLGV